MRDALYFPVIHSQMVGVDDFRPYFRHKVGVNSTNMVKISNLPSSMAAEQTQVWKSLSTP
jgi:hypothetical protein